MTVKRRRQVLEAAVLLVVFSLTVWAVVDDGPSAYWGSHQFTAGMAPGFASLGLTVFAVDRILAWRDDRRWARVAVVAYRGIGRTSRDIANGLAALYCDPVQHTLDAPRPGSPGRDRRALDPLDSVGPMPRGKDDLRAFSTELPSQHAPADDIVPEERLTALIEDDEWCEFASHRIAEMVDVNRRCIAEWAPVMMAADQPRDLLNAFASLNDELFTLSIVLQRIQHARSDDERRNAIGMWRISDAKARILTNRFWKHANGGRFALALPIALREADFDAVFEDLRVLPSRWSKLSAFRFVGDPYVP